MAEEPATTSTTSPTPNIAEDESVKIKKSLNYSIKDGAYASAMTGISDPYLSAFAVTLGATNKQIGLLSSLANLFAPMFQLASLKQLRKGINRKKIVLGSVLAHALLLLLILLIPFIFPTAYRVPILIILFALFAIASQYSSSAWASWIGDLVPENARGDYFGRRNRIAGIVSIIATLLAGIVLNNFTQDKIFLGFALIFIAAVVFRLISLYYLSLKYEPKLILDGDEKFSLIKFVKKMRNDNFAKFVLFVTLIYVSVSIASPFFVVHMLRDLGWSYIQYTAILITSAVSSFLAMVYWGKNIDRFGSIAVLRYTTPLMALIPLPWIIAKGNIFIIAIAQLISGFAWSGFNLAIFTFTNDSSTKQQRALFFTYFNILNGIGLFIGANLGGLLADYKIPIMPNIFAYSLYTVMLISSILRLLVTAYFLPQIKEVKPVEPGKMHFEIFGINHSGIVKKVISGIHIGSQKAREARWKKWFKGNFFKEEKEKESKEKEKEGKKE